MKLRKSGLVRELEGKWHVAKCSYVSVCVGNYQVWKMNN